MIRYDNIMQDNVHAPKPQNNLWLKDDELYYFKNGEWHKIGAGSSGEFEGDLDTITIEDINNLFK